MLYVALVLVYAGFSVNAAPSGGDVNEMRKTVYHFSHSTEDQFRTETGVLVNKNGTQVLQVEGLYKFVLNEKAYYVSFVADENGYRPVVYEEPIKKPPPVTTTPFPRPQQISPNLIASLAGGGLG